MKVRNSATSQSALWLRRRHYVWGQPVIMDRNTESSGFGGAAHTLSISAIDVNECLARSPRPIMALGHPSGARVRLPSPVGC